MELQSVGGTQVANPEPQRASRAPAAAVIELPPAVDAQKVQNAVAALNRAMATLSRELAFSSDPESGHTVIRVMDMETKQVIRQIPSEDALAITHAIDKLQGLMLRQKA